MQKLDNFKKALGSVSSIVDMAHGPKRNLNVTGLDAPDVQTKNPNGQQWDVNRASGRAEARTMLAGVSE